MAEIKGAELRLMIRLRKRAHRRQRGRCWWCKEQMHVGPPNNHPRQCSAEHLIRKADGGETNASNIVAACRQCNSERDEIYRAETQIRSVGNSAPSSPFEVLAQLRRNLDDNRQ